MRRHTARLAIAAASIAVAFAICGRGSKHASTPRTSVAPASVHYRYATGVNERDQTSSIIQQLEARAATPIASPEDLGELASLYVRRAMTDGDIADYDRAEQMARRSLAMRASPNGSTVVLAKVASARHQFREAIAIAEAALQVKPAAGTYDLVATCYLALGDFPQAVRAADAAVHQEPSPATFLTRALVLQAQGRDAEAAFDFSEAVRTESFGDPEEAARTRALWGRHLLRQGDLASAELVIKEALRIVPTHSLAMAQAAELALRRGQLAAARTLFEQAFSTSRQVRYLIDLARARELSKDVTGANTTRTQAERLLRRDLADNGTGHQLELVEILLDRGTPADLAEALPLARQEVTRRPSADTRFQLARALWRTGSTVEAATEIQAVLASGVHDARVYSLAARIEGGARGAMYERQARLLDPVNAGWRVLGLGR